ncbi:MAG: glycosyltransferase family 2 protein [Chloroflexota bacterium]
MKISVVTTLYRSVPYIEAFYTRMKCELLTLTPDYEIIFVNDGSPDDSLNLARELIARDPAVRVIDLSRNFGHHKAIMTGLQHVTGDLVFLIDVDLEEPPELLGQFYQDLKTHEVDVVFGVMDRRYGSLFRQISGILYYKIINWLSPTPLPENMLIARLMSRRYVNALIQHKEHVFIIGGLWQITGFRQRSITVEKRYKGETTYSIRRRIAMTIDSVTAYSSKPLILISYLGLLLSIPSGILIVIFIIQRLFFKVGIDGWSSLIVSVWFLGGLIISILGVIAIYLAVIFTEVKARPYTIIREIYEADPPSVINE